MSDEAPRTVEVQLPDQLPTVAVIKALAHLGDHNHEGVGVHEHFFSALMEELKLSARQPPPRRTRRARRNR